MSIHDLFRSCQSPVHARRIRSARDEDLALSLGADHVLLIPRYAFVQSPTESPTIDLVFEEERLSTAFFDATLCVKRARWRWPLEQPIDINVCTKKDSESAIQVYTTDLARFPLCLGRVLGSCNGVNHGTVLFA